MFSCEMMVGSGFAFRPNQSNRKPIGRAGRLTRFMLSRTPAGSCVPHLRNSGWVAPMISRSASLRAVSSAEEAIRTRVAGTPVDSPMRPISASMVSMSARAGVSASTTTVWARSAYFVNGKPEVTKKPRFGISAKFGRPEKSIFESASIIALMSSTWPSRQLPSFRYVNENPYCSELRIPSLKAGISTVCAAACRPSSSTGRRRRVASVVVLAEVRLNACTSSLLIRIVRRDSLSRDGGL